MKSYKFYENCYYVSIGCDCCESDLMYYYESDGFGTNGTPSSVEDCYLACIELEDNTLSQEGWDSLYELTKTELEVLCRDKYNFVIEIEFME